jgi:HD-GYP domain-containing protein (c-di-GMP phosphodiesterase class II)
MDSSNLSESPLYNSRIIDSYIRLIRFKYNYVNIHELLDFAGMKDYQVADQAHWFTQVQVDRFYEKLVQLTGNPGIAREAGRYAASPDALGAMRKYVLGLVGAAKTFEIIDKTASNIAKSSHYRSRRISTNRVEVIVTPRVEGLEKQFQCENRIGFFETIVMMFSQKSPDILHPECIFKGGKVCRYIITWERTLSDIMKQARNIVILLLAVCNLILLLAGQWSLLKGSLPISLVLLLLVLIAVEKSEKRELVTSLKNTRDTNDNLIEQININYNNSHMTNEIGQALGSCTNTSAILANVVQIMEKRLDFSRGNIFLANRDRTLLEMQTCYGYTPDQFVYLSRLSFHLDRPDSKGIFVVAFRDQRPFLINNLNEIEDSITPRSLAIARKLGTQSFICCPITCEGKSLGILAVDNVRTKRSLLESDVSLLMGIASVIGISIRNSELIDAQVRVFKSILHVLAASIDARDSLTAGHSEKVTEYTLAICNELRLSPEYCEMIRVAAMLHDYGKIWVPDAILKKEGLLTADEYEIVKIHSKKTLEILSQINFEGIFRQVPEIAGAHHEKLDGSGYPRGLKGEQIPLGARIIAVADYFEAITAKRHYRDPMPVDVAFALLRNESGIHLEKRFVEALIAHYVRTNSENPAAPAELGCPAADPPVPEAVGNHP